MTIPVVFRTHSSCKWHLRTHSNRMKCMCTEMASNLLLNIKIHPVNAITLDLVWSMKKFDQMSYYHCQFQLICYKIRKMRILFIFSVFIVSTLMSSANGNSNIQQIILSRKSWHSVCRHFQVWDISLEDPTWKRLNHRAITYAIFYLKLHCTTHVPNIVVTYRVKMQKLSNLRRNVKLMLYAWRNRILLTFFAEKYAQNWQKPYFIKTHKSNNNSVNRQSFLWHFG